MPLRRPALDDDVERALLVTVLPPVRRPHDTRPEGTSVTLGPTAEHNQKEEHDRDHGVQDTNHSR